MGGLTLKERDSTRYLFAYECSCGRTSLFALEAESEAVARLLLAPVVAKHIEREAQEAGNG